MDILQCISTTTNAAETVFKFSTYDWDLKSFGKLAIASSTMVGLFAVVSCIENNRNMNSNTKKRKSIKKSNKRK